MSPELYLLIGTIVLQLLKQMSENKPISTDLTPLTDAEKQAIDAKMAEVNAAVAAWNAVK